MRILFVKLSSIGDVVHTLPALSAIKSKFPDAEISWVVERRSAEILRNNPLLSRLIEIDTRALRQKSELGKTLIAARQQLRELRESSFDFSIDFQGLLKSASIAKLSKTKTRFGFSKENLRESPSRFLLTDTIPVDPKTNIVRKNLALAEGSIAGYLSKPQLSLEARYDFPIFPDDAHFNEADGIEEKAGNEFIILNPAGGWETKLWHAEKYGRLADLIWEEFGYASIISTAPDELPLGQTAISGSKSGKAILAQPSLKGFFALSKKARAYVGGDTAPTHLAVAAGCPIIGIFGPTEWWRNGSINPSDICVARKDIGCRVDCHRRSCDKWICMDISVETVFAALKQRLRVT